MRIITPASRRKAFQVPNDVAWLVLVCGLLLSTGRVLFSASEKVTREECRRCTQHQPFEKQSPSLQGKGFALQLSRHGLPAHLQAIRIAGSSDYALRPERKRGAFSSIIYRMTGLFQGVFCRFPAQQGPFFHKTVFDDTQTVPESLLCESLPVVLGMLANVCRFSKQVPLNFNGHRWTRCLTQTRKAFIIADHPNVMGTWAACAVVSILIFVLVQTMLSTRAKAQHMAQELTLDLRKSEDKYRILVDNSYDILFTLTHDGIFSFVSPAWHRLLGHLEDQVLGHRFQDFVHPDDLAPFMVFLKTTLSSGLRQPNVEHRMLHSNGSWVWLCTSAMPLKDEADRIVGAECSARDITERRRIEESLTHTAERLTVATRAGGVGIWDFDVASNRLLWDDQMFRLYGITRETFSGAYEAWQQGLHPEDRQRGDEAIRLALSGEKEFDIDFRVLWPDKTIHCIRGVASVQRNAAGVPLRMIGTNWDITAIKQTEKALRESESNFRTFFETMTDMIIVATPEGKILFTNAAVPRILGYTPADLETKHLLDLHQAEKRGEANEIFAAMFRKERATCPLPLARKDGRLVPVETRVWFGKWDGADCLFGICKDLSAEQEAKQLFERLFRNNPSLIALSSLPDRRFLDVNDTFLTRLGYTYEDIIGRTASDIGLFLDPHQHALIAERLLLEGNFRDAEFQVRRKDGIVLTGLFSGEIINSQSRSYLLTVMNDITARKRAEAELSRLSHLQHTLMLLAADFVNVPLDKQDTAIRHSLETMGQLIQADRAYLFAYDFNREVMSNTHEWCGPGISPEIGNLQEVPFSVVVEWVGAHRRGERMHIPDVTALPTESGLRQVLEPQGIRSLITLPLLHKSTCLGFVGFDAVREKRVWQEEEVSLLNVLAELYANFEARRAAESEMRDLQNRLSQACAAAQEAGRAKSLFLANMSHEIRTPLNAILGYAQIMDRTCKKCPTGDRLKAISRSGEHLLQLLNDLLDLARSDSQALALSEKVFDFHSSLDDVHLMFARHAASQYLTLIFRRDPEVPRFICSDPVKIRQVLVNLIGNALKFTTTGRIDVYTHVLRLNEAGDASLSIDIHDTGCGINASELETIFNVFDQAESGKKSGKGAGLGLPLSRRYAQALGGDITVTSTPGEGSRFCFVFLAKVSAEADLKPTRKICRLVTGQQTCRVLVVDDDLSSRELLVDFLEPVGFKVEAVGNAAQALSRLSQPCKIDLVLLDKQMPGISGYEMLRRLRGYPGGKDFSVLIVTASGSANERALALAAQANGYVPKPLQRDFLLEEISRVTGVRYEYDTVPYSGPHSEPHEGLRPEDLSVFSQDQQDSLLSALLHGDIMRLRTLVEGFSHEYAGLASQLGSLVNTYDYDRLYFLLNAAKKGSPDATR